MTSIRHLASLRPQAAAAAQQLVPKQLVAQDLHKMVNVFNIEGGDCAARLKKGATWQNLAVVIDRPMLEDRTLGDISKGAEAKKYKLKESLVQDYNESKVNLAYLLVSRWAMENVHAHQHIPKDREAVVTFQIHRAKSALPQARLIKDMLLAAVPDCEELHDKAQPDLCSLRLPKANVRAEFRNVTEHGTAECVGYENTDILVSLSLVGGLSHSLPSGSFVMPSSFVPMDTDKDNKVLRLGDRYTVTNDLCAVLPQVLESQRPEDLTLANGRFASPNPDKAHQSTEALRLGDFTDGRTSEPALQINTIWNPRNRAEPIAVQEAPSLRMAA